jgi:fatty acid desaturase
MNGTEAAPATSAPPTRGLRLAAFLALFGLLLSIIHFIWPSPLMFTIFMLFGQSAFGVAMVLYGWVILRDLRHRKAL